MGLERDLYLPNGFPSLVPQAESVPSYCRSIYLPAQLSRSSHFRDAATQCCMRSPSSLPDGRNVQANNDERFRGIHSAESGVCPRGLEEEHIAKHAPESFGETPYQKRRKWECSAVFAGEGQALLLSFCCAEAPGLRKL